MNRCPLAAAEVRGGSGPGLPCTCADGGAHEDAVWRAAMEPAELVAGVRLLVVGVLAWLAWRWRRVWRG